MKLNSVYVVTCVCRMSVSSEIDFVYFIRILGDHLSAASFRLALAHRNKVLAEACRLAICDFALP